MLQVPIPHGSGGDHTHHADYRPAFWGIVLGVIVGLLRPLFLRAVFGPWLRRREVGWAVKRR